MRGSVIYRSVRTDRFVDPIILNARMARHG